LGLRAAAYSRYCNEIERDIAARTNDVQQNRLVSCLGRAAIDLIKATIDGVGHRAVHQKSRSTRWHYSARADAEARLTPHATPPRNPFIIARMFASGQDSQQAARQIEMGDAAARMVASVHDRSNSPMLHRRRRQLAPRQVPTRRMSATEGAGQKLPFVSPIK
jgi:acetyl-CoA acetyltransferase